MTKKKKVSSMKRRQWMWGYLMIAPVVLGLAVFLHLSVLRYTGKQL